MNNIIKEKNQKEEIILSVNNLKINFYVNKQIVKAVRGIDFSIHKNEIVGLVGESGAGKSVCALSLLQLLPPLSSCEVSGEICFKGENLLKLNEKEMQRIRGAKISMIFQEPAISLNPLLSIGYQIAESIKLHQKVDKIKTKEKVLEILNLVKIPDPLKRIKEYPYEMSGGMKQRAMIAMALVSNPSLLIADEPTTALDVTIQKQIIYLIKELQKKFGTSILFITHNLGIIAEVADKVMVMYSGKIVESAPVKEIFHNPRHPYTSSLLKSIPRLNYSKVNRLNSIPGSLPNPVDNIQGCLFHPRCSLSSSVCEKKEPEMMRVANDHYVYCWKILNK